MARAAINVLGDSGNAYDFVSQGISEVTSSRKSKGVYCIAGCLGMVPFPPIDVGWGYTVNQVDGRADVETDFADGLLIVTVTKDGQPYDLKHMITLHILVPDAPALYMPAMTEAPAIEVGPNPEA
ncbi:phage tail protein [Pseudomonas sp. RTB3]|uniref:phage tail protein n=1 Tax=unclassified Pseudomonas TaxID=196821 RepID=UPI002B23D998|nr:MULTISPECIES: phage tail protein [unclassified Pseudomonas]MEB0009735.1 phage tail protein [Pseudomonas sp. RTB2]MEB0015958.1 phage tail protein [Pseudomonas sp. RTB3]MEB0271800.1 phage tail protein [Pseudomonas sp. 5B4]